MHTPSESEWMKIATPAEAAAGATGCRESRERAIEATVQIGELATRYRRAGRGHPTLLIMAEDDDDREVDELFQVLSGQLRVMAIPASDAPEVSPLVWLRTLIDTLGFERAHLVVGERFGLEAIAFTLVDPARAGRVAVLMRTPPRGTDPLDSALPEATIQGTPGEQSHRLLLLRRERTGSSGGFSASAALLAFLAPDCCSDRR